MIVSILSSKNYQHEITDWFKETTPPIVSFHLKNDENITLIFIGCYFHSTRTLLLIIQDYFNFVGIPIDKNWCCYHLFAIVFLYKHVDNIF